MITTEQQANNNNLQILTFNEWIYGTVIAANGVPQDDIISYFFVGSLVRLYEHLSSQSGKTVNSPIVLYVSLCPAYTTNISDTMGRILIKLGENVGTLWFDWL